jgi:putative ABC transport system permease protein
MIAAVPPVRAVAAVAQIQGATVRRTAAVPPIETGGISVYATSSRLLPTVSARPAIGHDLDAVADRYPEVVLGAQAAATLGVTRLDPATQVYLGGAYMTVVGVLDPVDVAPELDEAALVSAPVARDLLHADTTPTRIYLRTDPDQVAAVAAVLPFTASPAQPEAVQVRRPSDVLVARLAAKSAFTGLFLGLGAVALLVGGVGIANIMVISVLERRGEIGVRRALGARAVHVGGQFLGESLVLAAAGGVLGVALGAATTVVTARLSAEPAVVPVAAVAGGLGAALVVGALAGIYPAVRAARLAPAEALRAL